MGMMIGSGNGNVQRIVFKDANGMEVGSMSIRKSSKKKTKKLQYNFKEISARILQTQNSGSAREVLILAKGRLALLRQKAKGGEYDDRELQAAIEHAEKMERAARKKMRHLQEEEWAANGGFCQEEPLQEEEEPAMGQEETAPENGDSERLQQETRQEISRRQQEMMREQLEQQQEMMREQQKIMQELMENTQRELADLSGIEELTDALGGGTAAADLDLRELKELKTKHRLEEQREIMEADMLYLKAYFQKLAQEKQESAAGGYSSGDSGSESGGVSLELGGMEMPVVQAEVPVMAEGGLIDTSV